MLFAALRGAVYTKYVFVDSEFFHGKGFYSGYESKKYSSLEEQLKHSNHPDFWLKKIKRNMQHDEEVNEKLSEMGWKVLRFWSKDVQKRTDYCVEQIQKTILDNDTNSPM